MHITAPLYPHVIACRSHRGIVAYRDSGYLMVVERRRLRRRS
jgi:hypothetical protein